MKILLAGDFYGGDQNGSNTHNLLKNAPNSLEDLINFKKDYQCFIFNFESPILPNISNKQFKTGPTLHSDKNILDHDLFKENTILTLSNNHIMDYGSHGLDETLYQLETRKIPYLGAGDKSVNYNRLKVIKIGQINLGIYNVSENEWSSGKWNSKGANPLDLAEDLRVLKEARKQCEIVITIFHGGLEYYNLPTPEQQKICRFFIDSGSDVVVCHHSHYYSGYEEWKGKPIFYGLGNFIFDSQPSNGKKQENWFTGLMLEINVVTLEFELIPIKHSSNSGQMLEFLEGKEKEAVLDSIRELNSIIKSEERLFKSFEIELIKKESIYMSFLQPYNSNLRALYKKGLLPNLLSRDHIALLINLVRCETHREILINLLRKELEK
jgi:poly-gamma-glutamate capsule biosynthesis protein CapA/YwtB (metallophosphatase superfamily)